MTTTEKIARKAADLGYETTQTLGIRTSIEAFDANENVRIAANFIEGCFAGGYTVDHMGHLTSHRTASELLRFAG